MERSKTWRKQHPHSCDSLLTGNFVDYPATRMFDNLYFIGNDAMACYLLDTSEGLVLIDCMDRGFFGYIENGIRSLNFDPADLKHILITHGHGDHFGDSNHFREKYGTKLYMSEKDEQFATDPSIPRPAHRPGLDYRMDGYIKAGEDFICGDTIIKLYDTPGHTPGCLSMILTAYDEGRPCKLALWGGTGAPRATSDKKTILESCDYFAECAFREGVIGEISNHPFVDNTIERLTALRNIVDGVPHPFVLGYEGYRKIELMYRGLYVDSLKGIG
ncbi:MAG: MBL fold metallo-hydrolase [Youngiibacter sp.]|nr:MBL fold metallo-hydrolase [Youngiibacter sp.]